MNYIGVDLGTTNCKACLYDENGTVLAKSASPQRLITENGSAEQDANGWFEGVKRCIKALAAKNVAAIGISTQGISFVPVDRDGNPLCNAVTWLDTRAHAETERLREVFGEKVIYEKTGKPLNAAYTLPKLLWLQAHRPDLYRRADQFLLPLDYLNLKLTGRAVTDRSMASGTMLYHLAARDWDADLTEFSGIAREQLPEIGTAGTRVGTLLPNAARELDLPETVTVILGGQDQKLAALGAGIAEGVCTVSLGTATAVSKLNPPHGSGCPLFDFDDGRVFAEASIPTTGAAIAWLSGVLRVGYGEMDALAAKSPSGANGVRFGVDFTVGGGVSGLTLNTSSGDLVRALYEGIAREIKDKIAQMGGAERLRVFGGGANSAVLLRVISEVTQIDLRAARTAETAALGAAILAKKGAGIC
ncbi:MAG: hypothetical protein LBH54_02070 [Clostridiales bacterium]|jgi:xylulokinase|nr:hypothetical protein [Clostridiales bacterium]